MNLERKFLSNSQILPELLDNEELFKRIENDLPKNYNFEILKTLNAIRKNGYKRLALQFPEGLLMFSTQIASLLEDFGRYEDNLVETIIMGDVTYGACCVDDFTADSLGCDFLVHYGHSCLVPINLTKIKAMYVFVDIKIDLNHFIETIKLNFSSSQKIAFLSTIQFASSLQGALEFLKNEHGYKNISIPQVKPLSPGEVLGCTSPRLTKNEEIVIYLGDGRFHLESIMIANPQLKENFYKYDPYCSELTHEYYDYQFTYSKRRNAIEGLRESNKTMNIGIIVGTLGRQGSLSVLNYIKERCEKQGHYVFVVLLSEITPSKLDLFDSEEDCIDFWVQIACPRLSIDWGHTFKKPLLTPYELTIVLMQPTEWNVQKPGWMKEDSEQTENDIYPMDFYSKTSLGPWTPNYTTKNNSEKVRPSLSWKEKMKLKNEEKKDMLEITSKLLDI
jgi:2-(3-amino-3-carboxypropyl)histidine synthase